MSEYETPPWDNNEPEEPEPKKLQCSKVADVCVCGCFQAPTFLDGVEVCMYCTKNISEDLPHIAKKSKK